MADPESLLEMSQNFITSDFKNPWMHEEDVPMDVYTACAIGQYDIVRDFLKSDTDSTTINKHNKGGWTSLMYAAYVGHETIVSLLLDHNVQVDNRTSQRAATALMLAASCGNEPVVYFLLQSRADINAVDANGETALFYATHQGHQNVVKMLIDSGSDMDKSENKHGLTPLLDAAKEGHEGIFNLLLLSGANSKAVTTSGKDARQIALQYGNMPIVNLLDMQAYKHTPNSLLRSEPGLGNDDMMFLQELGSSPDKKVNDWLGNYAHGSPGIQDGPEAFAWIRKQQKNQQPSHLAIPTGSPDVPPGASCPKSIPRRCIPNHLGEPHPGSYEDNFFAHSGETVKSASLGRRIEQLELNDVGSDGGTQSCGSSRPSTPPELPLLSTFLEDLKVDKYSSTFEKQEVDFETLLTLTDADLKEIGIALFGPRRKIMTAITKWKDNHPAKTIRMKNLEVEVHELKVALHNSWIQIQHCQAQLLQEQELRSIVEGCLVEERAKLQQVATVLDTISSQYKQMVPELEGITSISKEVGETDEASKKVHEKLAQLLEKVGGVVEKLPTSTVDDQSTSDKMALFQLSSSSGSTHSSESKPG